MNFYHFEDLVFFVADTLAIPLDDGSARGHYFDLVLVCSALLFDFFGAALVDCC